jgi:DtxR family transcriptional regulator, Mn-dependent transcriptional regulator
MTSTTGISDSMENYLEVILDLEKTQRVARGKDIAEKLEIQRGSVSGALKSMEEKGLIHYEPYGFITLTRNGKKLAGEISRKHQVLKDFFLNVLWIDPDTAERTACRMEHGIDQKTLERLVCFIEYIHKCPRAGEDWIKSFVRFCESDEKARETCDECVNELKAIHS